MENNTSWTPSPDENKLGINDKVQLNEFEALGIARAELYIFQLESDAPLSTQLLLEIHRIAFIELYDWAGKWRNTKVVVGQLTPPEPTEVIHQMYQFIDNLNYKKSVHQ